MFAMKHGVQSARKFRHAIRLARQHMPPHLPAGLFLTDPRRTPDPVQTILQLPDGVGVIFRHFGIEGRHTLARQIAGVCRHQNRPLLVAADAALADSVGADGVHWPARLSGQICARGRRAGLNTMSVHSVAELRRARTLGMDAILVSAVFASESPSAPPPMGTGRLAALSASTQLPVYALGGITSRNVTRVARLTGFASVSGLAEVFSRT